MDRGELPGFMRKKKGVAAPVLLRFRTERNVSEWSTSPDSWRQRGSRCSPKLRSAVNVTKHPTSLWITQQLREAFPYDTNSKYLIYDRDSKFGEQVSEAVIALALQPVRTSFRSPWQNGIAERWVGACRRDLLDHVIPLNEKHLKRLLAEYVRYFHHDRTHLGLEKDTPHSRPVAAQTPDSNIVSRPRLGGLHHRYDIAA